MIEHKLPPPHLRRKSEVADRYPETQKPRQIFKPEEGMQLNLGGQIWIITETKTRGRWKAAFSGEAPPKFKPEAGMGLDFKEPKRLQEIYQAKKKSFWAKPLLI